MNIDGFTIQVDPTTQTATVYRWGMNLVVRFADIHRVMEWIYAVGCAKQHYPDGLEIGAIRELARDFRGSILLNEFP
jgi:hypothetical protein